MKRAIHIFPTFHTPNKIQEIRKRYDPLSNKIPPHITLVFPFDSCIPQKELIQHVESVANLFSPFSLTMNGMTGSDEEYLFLNVKQGNDPLIHLHDELYKGILSSFRNVHITYIPHMTLGRLADREKWTAVVEDYKDWAENFQTIVKEIVVEEIGADEVAHIIGRVRLNENRFQLQL